MPISAQTTKHERVYQNLRSRVLSGDLKPGQKMLSERKLVSRHHVSRITITRAMKRLETEGLITRGIGSGSYVLDRRKMPGEISVVISNVDLQPGGSLYFRMACSKLMRAIDQANPRWSARIHMADCLNNSAKQPLNLDLLSSHLLSRLRGVFTFNSLPDIADQLDQQGVPLIFMSIDTAFQWKYQVFFDYPLLYKQAMAHLKGVGCKTVGVLWQSPDLVVDRNVSRATWFTRAAQELSLDFKPQWMLREATDPVHPETLGYEMFHRFWRLADRPQSLFVDDEVIGSGVLRAALELGVDFPTDLKLIIAATRGSTLPYHKQVTRIEFDPDQQIQVGLDLMSELQNDPTIEHRQVFIPGQFVQGQTA